MSGSLRAYNTLRLESRAAAVHVIRHAAELEALARDHGNALLVLGEGSNVVLAPSVDRPVCIVRSRGIWAHAIDDAHLHVTAAAGESWHDLVRWSLGQGLCGLENLALIPGSVGAAPVQNIGAYGVELADRLVRLRALDLERARLCQFDSAECGFDYRDSVFKSGAQRFAIIDVTLRLSRKPVLSLDYPDVRQELARMAVTAPRPVDVAEAVVRVRRRKLPDPRRTPNVGSFFKNPVVDAARIGILATRVPDLKSFPFGGNFKLSAAQLIDQAGWKTRSEGPIEVWQRQPLVLVNRTGVTDGRVVVEFAERIRADIESRYGVRLEMEPDAIGF